MPIESRNPANGKLLRSFDPLTPEALEARLALAAEASKRAPSERLEDRVFWMRRLALLLDQDADELAALITAEMGKTLPSARQEVQKCARAAGFYAENAAKFLAPRVDGNRAHRQLRTLGANGRGARRDAVEFSAVAGLSFSCPALMAGQRRPAEARGQRAAMCALVIETLVRRAGFPRGSFQSLLLETRQVETVLADVRVAAVTVTGSEAAGRAVAAQAGWLIKKTVLELGGSDPFIVMPSADLEACRDQCREGSLHQQWPVLHRCKTIHRSRRCVRRV